MTSSSDAASARTACDLGGQLVLGAGVDGQVQAEAEQLALAAGQPVGQVAGVVGGGLGVRVVQLAAVRAGAAAGFQAGALAAQPGGGHRGRDRLDVQGDVEAARVGQQRLQPPGADLGRVAGDGEGGGAVVPDPHVPGGDLDGRRPGHVRGGAVPGAPGAAAQACGLMAGLPGLVTGWPGRASRPAWQWRRGGVGAGGEQRGDLPAVQHLDCRSARGQQPGGLAGALRGPRRRRCRRGAAGPPWPGSRMTSSAWRVSTSRSAARPVEERGVLEGGLLQGRVRQRRGRRRAAPATAADRSARPARIRIWTGPVRRVQPPAVGGGQGVLLGRAAQREVDRRHRGGDRGAAVAQADHPVGRDVRPQRRPAAPAAGPAAGRLRAGPGGRGGDALGGGDQAARGAGAGATRRPAAGPAAARPARPITSAAAASATGAASAANTGSGITCRVASTRPR